MQHIKKQLVFHGSIILMIGFLAGSPLHWGLAQGWLPSIVDAWRLAHGANVVGGLFVLFMALLLQQISLSSRQTRFFKWGALGAGYGFAVGTILAALTGIRGITLIMSFTNLIIYASYTIAVWGSFLAGALLIIGAYKTLKGST